MSAARLAVGLGSVGRKEPEAAALQTNVQATVARKKAVKSFMLLSVLQVDEFTVRSPRVSAFMPYSVLFGVFSLVQMELSPGKESY